MNATRGLMVIALLTILVDCGSRTGLLGDPSPGDMDGSIGPPGDGGTDPPGPDGSDSDASRRRDGSLEDGRVIGNEGCGDTQSTPKNCGACGHDCQRGACIQGVCQPFLLTDAESFPNTLTVDSTKVYWANLTDIDYGNPPSSIIVRSMDKNGGTPSTLDTIRPGFPTSLRRDGNYLYFYRSIVYTTIGQPHEGTVERVCADGSCPHVSLAGSVENRAWPIAVDDTLIFFPTSNTGGLSQIPKAGGTPVTMANLPAFDFSRLAVDDTYVYSVALPNDTIIATQPVMLVRALKAPHSVATPLMKGLIEGGDVAVDANAIFVSDTKKVYRLPKTGPGALQPVPITPLGKPGFLTIDNDRVYWLEYAEPSGPIPSSVHWVKKDGTGLGSMILANDATYGPGIAQDETALYWVATLAPLTPPTPAKGGIVKLVKPL